jgi:hypothetical protein
VPIRGVTDYAARLKLLKRDVSLFVDADAGHSLSVDPRTLEAYLYLEEKLLHRHLGGAAPAPRQCGAARAHQAQPAPGRSFAVGALTRSAQASPASFLDMCSMTRPCSCCGLKRITSAAFSTRHGMAGRPIEQVAGAHRLLACVAVGDREFAFDQVAPMRGLAQVVLQALQQGRDVRCPRRATKYSAAIVP